MLNRAQCHSPQEAFLLHGFIQSGTKFSSPLSQNRDPPCSLQSSWGPGGTFRPCLQHWVSPWETPCSRTGPGPRGAAAPGACPQPPGSMVRVLRRPLLLRPGGSIRPGTASLRVKFTPGTAKGRQQAAGCCQVWANYYWRDSIPAKLDFALVTCPTRANNIQSPGYLAPISITKLVGKAPSPQGFQNGAFILSHAESCQLRQIKPLSRNSLHLTQCFGEGKWHQPQVMFNTFSIYIKITQNKLKSKKPHCHLAGK